MALTGRLEYSEDALSDTTPTWQDVSTDLLSIKYWAGQDHQLGDPQPGGAELRLKNTNRRWEPDYVNGQFYPNIDTQRRFRFFLDDGTTETQEGLWYLSDLSIEYPVDTEYSEVTITCTDGFEIRSLDRLGPLDPPDASSFADVVIHDKPYAYFPMKEVSGTRMESIGTVNLRRDRFGRFRLVDNSSGADHGAYKNTPTLHQRPNGEPPVVGEDSWAVRFESANNEYAFTPLGNADAFADTNALSVECLHYGITGGGVQQTLMAGPEVNALTQPTFDLRTDAGDQYEFTVRLTDGTNRNAIGTSLASAAWAHLVATWDGQTARIYVNGILEAESFSASATVRTGNVQNLYIGKEAEGAEYLNGWLAEAAFYEHALSPERVLAHYQAARELGYAAEPAGERVAAAVTSDLWAETSILTGAHEVQPVMHVGQSPLEVITEAVRGERPSSLFFFNGEGDPVYLGWEYKATGTYNTVQAVLGDTEGEVLYQSVELDFDNEVFNTVTGSREGGELITVSDASSISARKERTRSDETSLLLTEDADVENVLDAILQRWKQPALRPTSVTVNSKQAQAQILSLDIGDLVRVKRRGEGGTPIDRVTHILGKEKDVVPIRGGNVLVVCTYRLARGFDAATGYWHAGISGFSEAGTGTVAA